MDHLVVSHSLKIRIPRDLRIILDIYTNKDELSSSFKIYDSIRKFTTLHLRFDSNIDRLSFLITFIKQ